MPDNPVRGAERRHGGWGDPVQMEGSLARLPARRSATRPADGLKAWGEFFAVAPHPTSHLTGKAPPQKGKPPFVADIDFDVAVRIRQDAREQVPPRSSRSDFRPHSDEAEQSLLGALMRSPGCP